MKLEILFFGTTQRFWCAKGWFALFSGMAIAPTLTQTKQSIGG